ncbi:MAG: type II toxin-antitoxin system antitoxin SocA domain-containing protein [Pseudomonadota bacterium]
MKNEENTNILSTIENTNIKYHNQNDFYAFEKNDNTGIDVNAKGINYQKEKTYLNKYSGGLSVFDVAAYILKKTGQITTMKLQKLVYYCQAWSLVWDEKPLFPEKIEAWANGPVIRELFAFHKGMFEISSIAIGNPDLLNFEQKETIDLVVEFYGDKPSQWLIDLSHQEEPWKKARVGLRVTDRGNRVISLDDIAEYYSSLPSEE